MVANGDHVVEMLNYIIVKLLTIYQSVHITYFNMKLLLVEKDIFTIGPYPIWAFIRRTYF